MRLSLTPDEFAQLRRNPVDVLVDVLEERYPGVIELVARRELNIGELLRMWGFTFWSSEKAKRELGYLPQHNFPEFFAALKAGDEGYFPFENLP